MQWRGARLPVLSGNCHGSKNPEGVGTFASVTLISVQNFPNTKLCKKLNPICTETSKHPEPSHQFSIIRGLNHCEGVAKRLNIVFTLQSVPRSISLGSCGQKGHLGRGWGVVGKGGGTSGGLSLLFILMGCTIVHGHSKPSLIFWWLGQKSLSLLFQWNLTASADPFHNLVITPTYKYCHPCAWNNLKWQTVKKRGCARHWWTSGVRDDGGGSPTDQLIELHCFEFLYWEAKHIAVD